jgi:hypothetical protein
MGVELVTGSMDRDNMQRNGSKKKVSAPDTLVWDCNIPQR